jgi:hypothetical protein
MSNKGNWQLVPLLLICTLFSSIALAAENPRREDVTLPGGDWLDNATTERLVVQSLYNRLATYAQDSGHDLKFKIGDLQVIRSGDFGSMRWLDVVSVPGGASLEIMRNVRENGRTGWMGVTYEPTWAWKSKAWNSPDEKEKLRGMSIADALQLVANEQPQLLDAEALTSYEVTAEMAGRSRTYRAALLWLPIASGAERTFIVVDSVTQGVEEAARETLPPTGQGDLRAAIEGLESLDSKVTCTSSSSTTQKVSADGGTNGHRSGSHLSRAAFEINCKCSTSCASTCTASLPSKTCTDTGSLSSVFSCHKLATDSRISTNRVDDGRRQGAACAAGLGCVEKNCTLCLCGIGVGVTILGTGVSFNITGNPEWTGDLQYSRTCGVCH